MKHKLVDGKTLYTDSTHRKASANKNKFVKKDVTRSTAAVLDDLDEDVEKDRRAHGKKPLNTKEAEPETKTITCSTTGG